MNILVERARSSQAFRFSEAWKEFRQTQVTRIGRRLTREEIWSHHRDLLHDTWEDLMQQLLSPGTWLLLRIVSERRNELRWKWMEPGGVFFTRRGNRRRGSRDYMQQAFKKYKPKIPVNFVSRIEEAEQLLLSSFEENEPFDLNDLEMIVLALAGTFSYKAHPKPLHDFLTVLLSLLGRMTLLRLGIQPAAIALDSKKLSVKQMKELLIRHGELAEDQAKHYTSRDSARKGN